MRTRFFYRKSDFSWLHRIDTNSPLSRAEAITHVEEQFKLSGDVGVVETETLEMPRLDSLRLSPSWGGTPGSSLPSPLNILPSNLISSPKVPTDPRLDRINELEKKLQEDTIVFSELLELQRLERNLA